MAEESKPTEINSIDILYDIALKVLDKQMQSIDSLDGKLSAILAFIALTFGALSTFASSQANKLSQTAIILFWNAMLVFLVIIILGALAYRVRKFKYLLAGNRLQGIADLEMESKFLKSRLLAQLTNQLEYNDNILSQKTRYIQWAGLLTFTELLLTISLVLLTVLSDNPRFFQIG